MNYYNIFYFFNEITVNDTNKILKIKRKIYKVYTHDKIFSDIIYTLIFHVFSQKVYFL